MDCLSPVAPYDCLVPTANNGSRVSMFRVGLRSQGADSGDTMGDFPFDFDNVSAQLRRKETSEVETLTPAVDLDPEEVVVVLRRRLSRPGPIGRRQKIWGPV